MLPVRVWLALWLAIASAGLAHAQRLDGFNVIMTPEHPFGSAGARRALVDIKSTGATTIAVVPFLWQATPANTAVTRGSDVGDAALRAGIRDAHKLGLLVVVKPHVWVPDRWAGSIEPATDDDWRTWFVNYGQQIATIARIAAEEKADALAIGTELAKTTQRPEWTALISDIRTVYAGALFYVAHNIEEAERVPFWKHLDAIGVSLYPPLGADDDRAGQLGIMQDVAQRIETLAALHDKPVIVAEIGLRSARGAAARPWESAEERHAAPAPQLQADVLADWLAAVRRPAIRGVLVWRWFTDPAAGGAADTDFTVQGKPAEAMLRCAWSAVCASP